MASVRRDGDPTRLFFSRLSTGSSPTYWMMPDSSVETRSSLVTGFRAHALAGELWAILDACDAASVPAKAQELGEARAVSLYQNRAEADLWAIAPYLVTVNDALFDWITATLWSEPWGIFAVSDPGTTLEALRIHFRKFLVVESPDGEDWYFRFYDPRVLRGFLPMCNTSELSQLFGIVRAYGMTNPETYGVDVVVPVGARSQAAVPRVVVRRSA